jgi:hypothetical protein
MEHEGPPLPRDALSDAPGADNSDPLVDAGSDAFPLPLMEDQAGDGNIEGLGPTGLDSQLSEEHEEHCFIVMPSGQTSDERKFFRGWYEQVLRSTVVDYGYEPILAKDIDEPNAINDEIRGHLIFDPMVIVDLGGMGPLDLPNPNVMYELGIRHALDRAVVLLAWEGQRLPFDISNQRALISERGLIDVDPTRRRLKIGTAPGLVDS